MNCVMCKVGETEKGVVTVTLEREGSIILIKNVPAEVCTNCGHYYLSEDITKLILDKARNAVKGGAELEVLKLEEV